MKSNFNTFYLWITLLHNYICCFVDRFFEKTYETKTWFPFVKKVVTLLFLTWVVSLSKLFIRNLHRFQGVITSVQREVKNCAEKRCFCFWLLKTLLLQTHLANTYGLVFKSCIHCKYSNKSYDNRGKKQADKESVEHIGRQDPLIL